MSKAIHSDTFTEKARMIVRIQSSQRSNGLRVGSTSWGPAFVVLLVGFAMLILGPPIVRALVYAKEQSTIQRSSERLDAKQSTGFDQ